MDSGKKISTEAVICIILGVMVLFLGAAAAVIFAFGGIGSGNKDNTNIITSGIQYSTAIDTEIYEKPSSQSAVLAKVSKGVKVSFISYADDGYYKVKADDITGYVKGDYIVDDVLLSQQEEAQKVNMYIVNVDTSAKMYAEASSASATLADIEFGTQVRVFANTEGNGMRKVEYNGTTGYVEQQCLTEDYNIVQNQQNLKQKELDAKQKAEMEAARRASLPPGSSAVEPKYPMYVCNVQNAIYLRTHPSEYGDIITTIPVNTQVYYIDTCEGSWYKISYNGKMGYSKAQYLTRIAPSVSQPYNTGTVVNYRTITGVDKSAYLRRNATSDTGASNIICEVPKGTRVEYLGTYGEYGKVRYNGATGYVLLKYLY